MIGYKVKWNDSAINDFNEEDKLLQENRIYTIIKEISDNAYLISGQLHPPKGGCLSKG